MAQTMPWANDPIIGGGPLPSPPPKPDDNLPEGYRMGPGGSAERIPGLPPPEGSEKSATELDLEAKREGERRRAATIESIVGEVRRLYDQDLKGQPISRLGGMTEWIDSLPRNERFRNAANNILPLIRPLVAQTAREGDSDKEMEVFLSYIPHNDDSDITIEQKFKQLELLIGGMVDGKAPSQILAERQGQPAASASMGGAAVPPPASGQSAPLAAPAESPPPFAGRPFMNQEGQIAGNTHSGGGEQEQKLLDGQYRREDNPLLAGVREEYLKRLGRGDSVEQLFAWAREVGIDPSAEPSIRAQAAFREEHPEVSIGDYDASQIDDHLVKVDPLARGISNMARNALGPFLVSAGDAASGFTLDNIVGATGGNAEQARLGMGQIAEESPVSSTAGTVTGGVLAALGLERAAAGRLAPGLARALIGDAAYGAAAGAGSSDYAADGSPATVADRIMGAGQGTLAAGAGSVVGSTVGKMLGAAARGVTDTSVRTMSAEGVPLTVGQAYGRSGKVGESIKGLEDRIAGLPIAGDMVNSARGEGVRRMNTKAFDRALEPIGGTIGDAVGEDAVERAQQLVSNAFRDALSGKGAVPDNAFADALGEAVAKVRSVKRLGDEVTDQIGEILQPYADEALLSGEALDDISRGLRNLKGAYSADPLAIPLARRIDQVERAIFELFDRQASGTIPAYKAAREAYRRLSVLEDAVLKGKNTEGLFTAAQLGRADLTNAVRYGGKRSAARGDTPFFDLQRAAQNVLPNKVPDSGTAGRALLVPLIALGAGGTSDATGMTSGAGLTIGTILAALYTRGGQRLLTKPARGMKPGTKRRAVLESPKTGRAISVSGATSGAALATQQ